MSSTALLLSVLKREELNKTSYDPIKSLPENKENMEDISLRKQPSDSSALNNKRQIQNTTSMLHKLYANQKKKIEWNAYDVTTLDF